MSSHVTDIPVHYTQSQSHTHTHTLFHVHVHIHTNVHIPQTQPENVLLAGRSPGTVKLIDFGSARDLSTDSSPIITSSIEFCGKLLVTISGGSRNCGRGVQVKFWCAMPTSDRAAMHWPLSLNPAHCILYTCMAMVVQLRPHGKSCSASSKKKTWNVLPVYKLASSVSD